MEQRTCQRDGCTRSVPAGRSKYCTPECSKYMNRKRAAARSHDRYLEAAMSVRRAKTGRRRCLSCSRGFKSEGPWNRCCPKCARLNEGVGAGHTAHGLRSDAPPRLDS